MNNVSVNFPLAIDEQVLSDVVVSFGKPLISKRFYSCEKFEEQCTMQYSFFDKLLRRYDSFDKRFLHSLIEKYNSQEVAHINFHTKMRLFRGVRVGEIRRSIYSRIFETPQSVTYYLDIYKKS